LSGTGSADDFPTGLESDFDDSSHHDGLDSLDESSTGLANVESGSVDDFHTDETISEHNYRGNYRGKISGTL
jgi:hypothetical protein